MPKDEKEEQDLNQLREKFKQVRTNMLKAHPDSLIREKLFDSLVELGIAINNKFLNGNKENDCSKKKAAR